VRKEVPPQPQATSAEQIDMQRRLDKQADELTCWREMLQETEAQVALLTEDRERQRQAQQRRDTMEPAVHGEQSGGFLGLAALASKAENSTSDAIWMQHSSPNGPSVQALQESPGITMAAAANSALQHQLQSPSVAGVAQRAMKAEGGAPQFFSIATPYPDGVIDFEMVRLEGEPTLSHAKAAALYREVDRLRVKNLLARERSSTDLSALGQAVATAARAQAEAEADRDARAMECEQLIATGASTAVLDRERVAAQRWLEEDNQSIQSHLELGLQEAARLRQDAGVRRSELSWTRSELDAETAECSRLRSDARHNAMSNETAAEELYSVQLSLQEECRIQALTVEATAASSQELAVLHSELEAQTAECGRLRTDALHGSADAQQAMQRLVAELAQNRSVASRATLEAETASREVAGIRAQLAERANDLDRFHAAKDYASKSILQEARVAREELQSLQGMLDEELGRAAKVQTHSAAQLREVASLRQELGENADACRLLLAQVADCEQEKRKCDLCIEELEAKLQENIPVTPVPTGDVSKDASSLAQLADVQLHAANSGRSVSAPMIAEPDYVSTYDDDVDQKLEVTFRQLGPGVLKGHKLIRTKPSIYKLVGPIGTKKLFLKLIDDRIHARRGGGNLLLEEWLQEELPDGFDVHDDGTDLLAAMDAASPYAAVKD